MIRCNVAVVAGNLTRDIEIRYTQNGNAVASFTVAVNRSCKQSDGTYQEEVAFIPVVVWGKTAEVCERYLSKGDNILVQGRINQRSYETKTGEKRNVVEVVAESVQFPSRKDTVRGQEESQPSPRRAAPRGRSARDSWPPDDNASTDASVNTRSNFEEEDADIPF